MTLLEPLKFCPSLREKVWGTRDLRPLEVVSEFRIGEAWCVHDGSTVEGGELNGRSLPSLIDEFGPRLMGASWRSFGLRTGLPRSFPLLAKLLFADDILSVQVHPDAASAMRLEGRPGKTEMWYVLSADRDARLGLGTLARLDARGLASAARDGSIAEQLRWVPARRGQCVLVTPGTVHSIRGRLVLCEIQQNSDITYRLYDHGRVGLQGRPRALQVNRAVEVADTSLRPEPSPLGAPLPRPCRTEPIGRCPHFTADLLSWNGPFLFAPQPARCRVLVIVAGFGSVNGVAFQAGDSFLLPAEAERFPVDGWGAQAVCASPS